MIAVVLILSALTLLVATDLDSGREPADRAIDPPPDDKV
jgi:hypothetical protein